MTELGRSIEEYNVGEQLGRGGFAIVHRAKCRNTDREVAIKMIDICKIDAGGLTERVRQEVTIHSQLNHPAILKLFTFFEDHHYVYLILELCHNGELQKYIKSLQRNLYEDEAREYLSQILSGMLYLQSHSIMHRDLTLSNILLDNHGRVKIADFGLATLKRPDDRHTTMCGTPNYMSPEVATRSSHGLPADVWSFGCMLYIMLVGRPPFDGAGAKECIFTRVVIGDYKIPDYVSANARSLISECLQKNPKERIKMQAIPYHPFMSIGTKTEISRTSDSGMYTMSTMTSTNHTRMPLTVISESNASGYEPSLEGEHHSAKFHKEALRKHPASPPVKMRTSPRDLPPQNAGVIDSLKRKYTPLPSLKRTEDFALTAPAVPQPSKREKDVPEERRIYQQMHYHKENSSTSEDQRDSYYSLSNGSDEVLRNQPRGRLQRGNSEQNLIRNDVFKKETLARDAYSCGDYNTGYCQLELREHSANYFPPQSRSLDKNMSTGSPQMHVNLVRTVDHSNQIYTGTRHIEDTNRDISHCGKRSGQRRSRSEDRCREASQNSVEGSREVNYRETSKDRGRSHSHERYRPSSDQYRGQSLERNKDGLGEPEHRSYREKPVDCNTDKYCSCCQNTQHRSWCERRHTVEKSVSITSSSRLRNRGETENYCSKSSVSSNPYLSTEEVLKHPSTPRKGCVNKILGDILPIQDIPQPSRGKDCMDKVQTSLISKGCRTPTKKVPENSTQAIQQLVSPLCSKRLLARRQRAKNYFFNIMDNGDVCMEVLKGEKGNEKVVDVFHISSDGMRIILYRPNGGLGCQPGDAPPPLPTVGADCIFSYENLPRNYWERYRHAAKYVKIVKSQTAKITYFSEQARCTLMENSPDPDFEAVFNHGLKIMSRGKNLVAREMNGTSCTIPHSSAPRGLPESLHVSYNHFKEVRDHCLYLERVLTEVTEKTGLSCFPTKMGLIPPGKMTPPVSARGSSNPMENKENLPVSMQSFRSPRNAADQLQLGSFQESVASIRSVGHRAYATKQALTPRTSSNIPAEIPLIPKSPASRVYIHDIGWATEGSNGVVSVEYLDGTQVIMSSSDPKVVFTDEFKVTKTYSMNSVLPSTLQQKLSQMNIVLSTLAQPQKIAVDATFAKNRFGLR